ncbi:MAG TPA: alpha/beta hydrolase [Ferrovibrio sp.]|uniref:alpha/beta hydrolase n=1 Tax=Ferrovibrio sp. TaxID=1917215 RepID=UPI002B4B70E6|nr:alpha/beta hydrolase [Ferrovibrio sp.]HLT79138.1 alpha/beta hydrolase [Ferrovibrio sp.]
MLDQEAKAFLDAVKLANRPDYSTMTPKEARKLYKQTRSAVTPEPPEVSEVDNIAAPGPHGPIPLRYYRPAEVEKKEVLPVLVFYHGGGWVIGDLDTHDVVCRTLSNEGRCAVVSVDYRMGPEYKFPIAIDDAYAAVKWVVDEAKTLRIDPRRVAVGGDSAGGNLAAVVSLLARDVEDAPKIAYQLLIYPATDMHMDTESHRRFGEGHLLTRSSMDWFQEQYLNGPDDRDDWRASPLKAKSLAGLPPAYVLIAGHDPLRDEGEAYAMALKAADVSVVLREFEGQIHGFITMGKVMPQANQALAEMGVALKLAFGQG